MYRLSSSFYKRYNLTSTTLLNPTRCASDHSASAKLFADADREEMEEKLSPKSSPHPEQQYENWTGEESMQDAVLRMLVDKYKPLRSGSIKTADEKLQQNPPRLSNRSDSFVSPAKLLAPTWEPRSDNMDEYPTIAHTLKDQPLLPAIEGHKPWHTTFHAPTHAASSIHHGTFSSRSSIDAIRRDDKGEKTGKEDRKRKHVAGRLTEARESTLDYRLGLKGSGQDKRRFRTNPLNMKGWAGLVEDRIESARLGGQFKVVKGRGRPLATHVDERNPFIGREEFLMNRIVRRNGAAPPWVEAGGELDGAIGSFREVLRQSWTKRAIRTLTTQHPADLLSRLTLQEVVHFRDPGWEQREQAYHNAALKEANSLVRNYNGLAPYAARRPYYMLSVELNRVYHECAECVHQSIVDRTRGVSVGHFAVDDDVIADDQTGVLPPLRIWDMIRELLGRITKRAR